MKWIRINRAGNRRLFNLSTVQEIKYDGATQTLNFVFVNAASNFSIPDPDLNWSRWLLQVLSQDTIDADTNTQ